MQLTDWLVVIFIVAIVVVLLDGVRRKLAERRSRVVLKIDKSLPKDDVDPEELPNSELPNGGARTLVRDGQPAPSLRTLKTKRKLSFRNSRADLADEPGIRAVPVLLDAVDVEEERIEHTNVFADYSASDSFEADDFASDDSLAPESSSARAPQSGVQDGEDDADELIDGLDEEYEEDAMLGEETVARNQTGYMDTRYQGRDDDDEYEDDEEELEEDEEEELEEFEDDIEAPGEFADDDDLDEDEDDEDELDDDEEDEDFDDDEEDDEEDDDFDDDDEEDEEEDEGEEEDLDELEGLPEDEWGSEEETDVLVDDYESEPVLMQGAYDKAASQFSKAANQLDRAASHAASQLDKAASHAASQFDKAASLAVSQLDKAASHAASHFNRPERQEAQRIEPGFGGDAGDLGSDSFDDTAFSEDFSAAWLDETDTQDAPEAVKPAPATARAAQPAGGRPLPGKKEQGELFRESVAARETPREAPREENRLMAALQKAVPARSQPAPEPASAPAPQEVIIINVMARPGQPIYGSELLTVLLGQGMRLGDMSIFHRHADSNGSGHVMFSMANMVKPGTFDLATMDHFTTPGVSFFLQMPNKLGNMACFDKMLSAAAAVREAFDADLKDEHRSVFTRQTVEHCRQRVRDFELKLLSRK